MFLPEDFFDPCPSPIEPFDIHSYLESQIRQSTTCESSPHDENMLGTVEVHSPTSFVADTKTWAEFLHENKRVKIRTNHKSGRSLVPRKRAVINAQDACDIFLLAEHAATRTTHGHRNKSLLALGGDSVQISKFFGISPKAVRDIWNR